MSDLQLSLLAIGVAVVVAVYLYNWVQERSLRRRLRQAFGELHDDVLLEGGAESPLADGRLEPQLVPVPPASAARPASGAPPPAAGDPPVPGFDEALDYIAQIEADAPIPEAVAGDLASRIASCGKPARVAGFDPHSGAWEELVRGGGKSYSKLQAALQLVNRAGPVSAAHLAAFGDAIRQCGERVAARVACPDPRAALKRARELDAFCSGVDVAIGVNVVAEGPAAFPGSRIRGLAEAAGFKLEPDGVFHYRSEQRVTLFTLDNHEPAPFLPESVKGLSTHGITLLLDVPRVAHGAEALERMLEIARGLAAELGGRLVDDNRAALSEAGIARIKEQLASIHATMAAGGMPPGGERALRLFSG